MTSVSPNGPARVRVKREEEDFQKSSSKNAALAATLDAAEAYMRQLKLAKTEEEKIPLDRECRSLLKQAESLTEAINSRASNQSLPVTAPKAIVKLQQPRSNRDLSTREQIILLEGSKLHGSVFPPWREEPSDSEFDLKPGEPLFEDKTKLTLSNVQLEIFDGWRRPHEALPPPKLQEPNVPAEGSPTMINGKNVDLVQDVNTDCSVVASLCAGTARASHGHSKIASSIFHPYDYKLGRPAFSANGKYIFRLHFNGCYRKVIIDDLLPTSKTARTLHVVDRKNPGLLWPALVEKAYLKIRGGYDFPGSNSGTDLWVLTGWIPEQVFLQSDDVASSLLWRRVFNAFRYGDVFATAGTGKLSEREEECTGLSGEHDYAILDMKEDGDQRMLLIKNPWCEGMTWKGTFSTHTSDGIVYEEPSDKPYITETNSDLLTPGTFWMDLKDVFQNFGSIYLNWNPGLFSFRQDIHFTWDTSLSGHFGGSFARNPQYRVYSGSGGIVWLLLNRHFTTECRDSEPEMKDVGPGRVHRGSFISLYIFDNRGERVYSNDGAIARGPYVDSPNFLLKFEYPANTSYTVVVCEQGHPLSSFNFTLSAFSLRTLSIREATDKYVHHQKEDGAWTFSTSGGNASSTSYFTNPQFSIRLYNASDVILMLESCEEEFPVHLKLVWANGKRVTSISSRDVVGDSGEYKTGYAFVEIPSLQPGAYTIVCSTFERGQLGKFSLRIGTVSECAVERVPVEEAGRMVSKLPPALFLPEYNRLLAPLFIHRVTRLALVARPLLNKKRSSKNLRSPVRLAIDFGQGPSKRLLGVSGNGDFIDDLSSLRIMEIDVEPKMCNTIGLWIVVERLGCSGVEDNEGIDIDVLSDEPIEVGQWGFGDG